MVELEADLMNRRSAKLGGALHGRHRHRHLF
jgi:hypothetical protein